MASPASIAKHPIHPMLIVFPLGLWLFSIVADIVYLMGGDAGWATTAQYCIAGGCVGAVAAAVPGVIDALLMGNNHARKTAIWHGAVNVSVLLLFVVSFFLRVTGTPYVAPFILSLMGAAWLLVAGWLGGELVYVLGVAVTPQHDTLDEQISKSRLSPKFHAEDRHEDTRWAA